jgi:hypothetical protein
MRLVTFAAILGSLRRRDLWQVRIGGGKTMNDDKIKNAKHIIVGSQIVAESQIMAESQIAKESQPSAEKAKKDDWPIWMMYCYGMHLTYSGNSPRFGRRSNATGVHRGRKRRDQ